MGVAWGQIPLPPPTKTLNLTENISETPSTSHNAKHTHVNHARNYVPQSGTNF